LLPQRKGEGAGDNTTFCFRGGNGGEKGRKKGGERDGTSFFLPSKERRRSEGGREILLSPPIGKKGSEEGEIKASKREKKMGGENFLNPLHGNVRERKGGILSFFGKEGSCLTEK